MDGFRMDGLAINEVCLSLSLERVIPRDRSQRSDWGWGDALSDCIVGVDNALLVRIGQREDGTLGEAGNS
jgi:hypothetical protein